jgi:hypothetical protein
VSDKHKEHISTSPLIRNSSSTSSFLNILSASGSADVDAYNVTMEEFSPLLESPLSNYNSSSSSNGSSDGNVNLYYQTTDFLSSSVEVVSEKNMAEDNHLSINLKDAVSLENSNKSFQSTLHLHSINEELPKQIECQRQQIQPQIISRYNEDNKYNTNNKYNINHNEEEECKTEEEEEEAEELANKMRRSISNLLIELRVIRAFKLASQMNVNLPSYHCTENGIHTNNDNNFSVTSKATIPNNININNNCDPYAKRRVSYQYDRVVRKTKRSTSMPPRNDYNFYHLASVSSHDIILQSNNQNVGLK